MRKVVRDQRQGVVRYNVLVAGEMIGWVERSTAVFAAVTGLRWGAWYRGEVRSYHRSWREAVEMVEQLGQRGCPW